jgi:hypothetical protein
VKVTGKGRYTGTATAKFTVSQTANTIKFAGKSTAKALSLNVKQSAVKAKA